MRKQFKTRFSKVLGVCVLSLSLAFSAVPFTSFAAESQTNISLNQAKTAQENIITWAKTLVKIDYKDSLFGDKYVSSAGNGAEWFALSLGRLGVYDDYANYLGALYNYIINKYQEENKLDAVRMTEWHKLALAIAACGGDPTNVVLGDSQPINLLIDGVTDVDTQRLEDQGTNAFSWALLALDSIRYQVTDGATNTRDSLIKYMLSLQLENGGFPLSGNEADVDITAMVLQALAPYYTNNKSYEVLDYQGKSVNKSVRTAVDKALDYLSAQQQADGDFQSSKMSNSESTVQVIVALCSLGIDPDTDSRFIKGENTCIDGLMKYQNKDGGFIHSFEYDSNNPSASPDKSNGMASEQALYGLVAYTRFKSNLRSLYDCREEMSSELRDKIVSLRASIDSLGNDKTAIEAAYKSYQAIPLEERSYVYNYNKLADLMDAAGIKHDSGDLTSNSSVNYTGQRNLYDVFNNQPLSSSITEFTKADEASASGIKVSGSSDSYSITKLLYMLSVASNSGDYSNVKKELVSKLSSVQKINNEVNALIEDINATIYPINKLTANDQAAVSALVKRYEALSADDKLKITNYEDLTKALDKVGGKKADLPILPIAGGVLVVVIIIVVVIMMKKKNDGPASQAKAAAAGDVSNSKTEKQKKTSKSIQQDEDDLFN